MRESFIGILHPGNMGISIAASAQNSGYPVYWASQGRSQQTHDRANQFNLLDAHTLGQLCEKCPTIISVCPPHAAEKLAHQVLAHSFKGLYIDANAISPGRAKRINQAMIEAGANFVDGAIIGGPAWKPGETRLHLSGQRALEAASFFSGGPLEISIIGESPGKASALKMCYAAYTKGTSALLSAIMAAAENLGVRDQLEEQWGYDDPDFAEATKQRVRRVTAKAWRFAGEMDEIAETFREAGLPGDFHAAANVIYRRTAHFKDAAEMPALEDVLAALTAAESNDA